MTRRNPDHRRAKMPHEPAPFKALIGRWYRACGHLGGSVERQGVGRRLAPGLQPGPVHVQGNQNRQILGSRPGTLTNHLGCHLLDLVEADIARPYHVKKTDSEPDGVASGQSHQLRTDPEFLFEFPCPHDRSDGTEAPTLGMTFHKNQDLAPQTPARKRGLATSSTGGCWFSATPVRSEMGALSECAWWSVSRRRSRARSSRREPPDKPDRRPH